MSNKEAAERQIGLCLNGDIDRVEEASRAGMAAMAYALLDVADAIREQTAADQERYDAFVGRIK